MPADNVPTRLQPLPPMVYALDFSSWKRPALRRCIPGASVKFVRDVQQAPPGATLLVWGMKAQDALRAREDLQVWRVEDGFLRSVGLGADLIRPLSWVVDTRGIYYDATRPSDLEHLLLHAEFDAGLLHRARRLREQIVARGLTKYNVGQQVWQRPAAAGRVILVPGQVESDASLAYGAPGIRRNLDLVQAVRKDNPGAYVVYKPHPDVLAGLRATGVGEAEVGAWCDEVVVDAPMDRLLTAVDEVHVLTSLTGFEALLRGKPVTCYGQPFYAGWGLTRDQLAPPRRGRALSLDALVAGALLLYPHYFARSGNKLLTPEQALEELAAWRDQCGTATTWYRKALRMVLRRVVGVR